MPTLIHTMPVPPTWNGRPDPLGGAANGLLVETSHVTVQGLKILGQPVVETPQPGMKKRLYAIARFNRTLEDLEVAQCLFASDELIASLHVGIIAHGNGMVVRNCVFRGYTKDAVVYWTPGSTGHAMTHCLFDGMYSSTVWTAGIAGDFDYRNNVVTRRQLRLDLSERRVRSGRRRRRSCAVARRRPGRQDRTHYKVVDSYFGGNKKLAGTGTGARVEFADIDSSFLEMSGHQGGRRTGCARARLDEAQLSASRRGIGRREARRGSVHRGKRLHHPIRRSSLPCTSVCTSVRLTTTSQRTSRRVKSDKENVHDEADSVDCPLRLYFSPRLSPLLPARRWRRHRRLTCRRRSRATWGTCPTSSRDSPASWRASMTGGRCRASAPSAKCST